MPVTQIFDDSDPAVSYSTGWQKAGGSNEYSTTTSWTNQPGMTATLTFVGVQISVFGTVGPSSARLVSPQSNYTVDGGTPTVYTASQDQAIHYQTRFYVSPTLPEGQHTLVVTNLLDSDVLFLDYFVVDKSANDTSFSPKVVTVTLSASASSVSQTSAGTGKPSSNTGTIVGSALGAAVLIIAAVAVILWLRGRNNRNREAELPDSRFRDDRESVPALGHTRFPSDTSGTPGTSQPGHAFTSTSSDVAQPSLRTQPVQPVQDVPRAYEALPPPPGYTSGVPPLNQAQGANVLFSKSNNLGYNTTPRNVVNV